MPTGRTAPPDRAVRPVVAFFARRRPVRPTGHPAGSPRFRLPVSGPPSFEEVVERHYAALYRFAFSLTRREADAADLTQQTFLIWARRGHQLRDPARAGTWLFTTLHREFLRARRRGERRAEVGLDEQTLDELPAPSADVIRELDLAAVQGALLGLAEHHRAPLSLFYLTGHTYAEIAEILDVPLGTVMSRLSRAKTELRRALLLPGATAGHPAPRFQTQPGKEDARDGHR